MATTDKSLKHKGISCFIVDMKVRDTTQPYIPLPPPLAHLFPSIHATTSSMMLRPTFAVASPLFLPFAPLPSHHPSTVYRTVCLCLCLCAGPGRGAGQEGGQAGHPRLVHRHRQLRGLQGTDRRTRTARPITPLAVPPDAVCTLPPQLASGPSTPYPAPSRCPRCEC